MLRVLLNIVAAVLAGICAGVVTGLSPAIHINLVATLLLGASPVLLRYLDPLTLACFIVAMSITHTFLDTVPSIYLGAPEEATAFAVLPGHRMLLEGQGINAVRLMVVGSLGSIGAGVLLFPLVIVIMRHAYPVVKAGVPYVLLAVLAYMVVREHHWIAALKLAFLSGALGILVFALHQKDPLLPLFSGLFGSSTLLISLAQTNRIPAQMLCDDFRIDGKQATGAVVLGGFAALMTSLLPGLGPSQGAILASHADKRMDSDRFLIVIGAIGTANMLFSLATLYAAGIARNGSMIIVGELVSIGGRELAMLCCAALVSAGAAALLSLRIAKVFSSLITLVDYRVLCVSVLLLVTGIVLLFTGFIGICIFAVATCVGMLPSRWEVGKNHLMACLLVPIIMNYWL